MVEENPPQLPIRELDAYPDASADYVETGHANFVFSCSKTMHKMSLHDTLSGDEVISLPAPPQAPSKVHVSQDGCKAAFATATGAVYIWDVMTPSNMESFRAAEEPSAEITCMAWHPRGHVLAVGTAAGILYLWDLVVGTLLYPVEAHDGAIAAVKWTANGRIGVSVGAVDGRLRVWNPRNIDLLAELSKDTEQSTSPESRWHAAGIRSLDTIVDMSRVALTGGDDGSVLLSVLKPESMCGIFHTMTPHKPATPVTAVRIAEIDCPKPLRAASAARDGSVHLFDMDRRLPMGKFNHDHSPVHQLEFSADADVLFSAAKDTVRGWDARVAPEELGPVVFAGHPAKVNAFAITNGGRSLVTACDDGKLRTFDMRYPSGETPFANVEL